MELFLKITPNFLAMLLVTHKQIFNNKGMFTCRTIFYLKI